MPYVVIVLGVLLCYAFGAYASYALKADRYLPVYMAVAAGLPGFCWGCLVQLLKDDHKVYVASYLWDGYTVLIYALVPLIFFGARLNTLGTVGAVLIVVGAVLLGLSHR